MCDKNWFIDWLISFIDHFCVVLFWFCKFIFVLWFYYTLIELEFNVRLLPNIDTEYLFRSVINLHEFDGFQNKKCYVNRNKKLTRKKLQIWWFRWRKSGSNFMNFQCCCSCIMYGLIVFQAHKYRRTFYNCHFFDFAKSNLNMSQKYGSVSWRNA